MTPWKRRCVGRVKGSITLPPISTHGVNVSGFATLADEIYLEIVSYIPSVPIPTDSILWHMVHDSESYSEIRRSRHETLLSLTQTSRSLRRFFWRYLWQRIEVREGTKIPGKDDTLKYPGPSSCCNEYAVELVRQLEIVTIRNPLLAQYVNYLDVYIGEYSIKNVLAELARCLSLFPNLHTVQIDVVEKHRPHVSFEEIFEETFKKYSYPQIRSVFIMYVSVSFVASCPQVRRVGFTQYHSMTESCLRTMLGKCPHLEVLEGLDYPGYFLPNYFDLIVNDFPNLHTIQFTLLTLATDESTSSRVNILKKLNHLQTIVIMTPSYPPPSSDREVYECQWVELAKHILIHIQLRDNLEKTVVVVREDYDGSEHRILLKPKSSFDLEEGSFA